MKKSHGDGNQNIFRKDFPLDFGGPLGTYQGAQFQFFWIISVYWLHISLTKSMFKKSNFICPKTAGKWPQYAAHILQVLLIKWCETKLSNIQIAV